MNKLILDKYEYRKNLLGYMNMTNPKTGRYIGIWGNKWCELVVDGNLQRESGICKIDYFINNLRKQRKKVKTLLKYRLTKYKTAVRHANNRIGLLMDIIYTKNTIRKNYKKCLVEMIQNTN